MHGRRNYAWKDGRMEEEPVRLCCCFIYFCFYRQLVRSMWARCGGDVDNQVVGVVSREVFLPSSRVLVIELFIVALILVLSFRAAPPFR